jgi:hypothetical protein
MPVVSEEAVIPFVLGEENEHREPFAERLIERLSPFNTGPTKNGETDLEVFCRAIAKPYEAILEVCEEEGSEGEAGWVPAWGKLFNPLTCPAKYLPYLGQFTGTSIPKEATEEEARNLVIFGCNLFRGTLAHLNYVIGEVLGKGVPFDVLERTNPKTGLEAAYCITVIVPPGKNSKKLESAIEGAIPGGIVFRPIVEVEGSWLSAEKAWEEVGSGVLFENVKEGET